MGTHQGGLLLFLGPKQGCCLPHGPPQPPPIFSMLVSQTLAPRKREGQEQSRTCTLFICKYSLAYRCKANWKCNGHVVLEKFLADGLFQKCPLLDHKIKSDFKGLVLLSDLHNCLSLCENQ